MHQLCHGDYPAASALFYSSLFIHIRWNTSLLTMISSAEIHCDSDHSQNWTRWSVSSLCNYYTICMDDIGDVALFITHMTLEVQFQVQYFWLTTLDLLSSWQVKPSFSWRSRGDVLLVCLKDSQYPGIFKNLINRTPFRLWYVGMMTVQFFSCLPLTKVRGMQKNSCCLFLNSVHHLYHLWYLATQYFAHKVHIFSWFDHNMIVQTTIWWCRQQHNGTGNNMMVRTPPLKGD
jgi:hypothetical protein